jgi:hypothetical protein
MCLYLLQHIRVLKQSTIGEYRLILPKASYSVINKLALVPGQQLNKCLVDCAAIKMNTLAAERR